MTRILRETAEAFILQQPNDRPLVFIEPNKSDSCGCLMVHLGKHLNIDFSSCTTYSWHKKGHLLGTALGWGWNTWGTDHTTYGTLKQVVLKQLRSLQ